MNFSAWILSILGAFVLTTLVDILLPNGKMTAIIKMLSSLIVFGIIISPLIQIVRDDISIFDTTKFESNTSITQGIENRKIEYQKQSFASLVLSELEVEINVEIYQKKEDLSSIIEYVEIYVSEGSITHENENIDIREKLVLLAENYFNIEPSRVFVYE